MKGKKIRLEYDSEIKDNYNRDLCYVFVNGTFVNEAVLREGLAFPYLKNKKLRYYQILKNAFYEAVQRKKNLYKINLKFEKDYNKFINQYVFFEGRVNNIFVGERNTEIIFDNFIVIAKDYKLKIKKGDYIYVYGKLLKKGGRFVIYSEKKWIFYLI